MYSQIYSPHGISELSFNKDLSNKLEKINQNFIIFGNTGSGKLTRVYCYLSRIFGESVHKTHINTYTINKSLDIVYKSSNYHIEINPSNYGTNDKTIINTFLNELATVHNIITNGIRYFIIRDADNLNHKAQIYLKDLMDKTYRTARYILVCKNVCKIIEPLKTRFILLRNRSPNRDDIYKILMELSKKVNIKTSKRAINLIVDNSLQMGSVMNLNNIINIFQLSYITGKYLKYNINCTQQLDKLIDLINKGFSVKVITDIREIIYSLYVNNMNLSMIMIYLTKNYMNYDYQIIEKAAKYEKLMVNGNKNPLYLEGFILHLINIMKNHITVSIKKTRKGKSFKKI